MDRGIAQILFRTIPALVAIAAHRCLAPRANRHRNYSHQVLVDDQMAGRNPHIVNRRQLISLANQDRLRAVTTERDAQRLEIDEAARARRHRKARIL